MEDSMCTVAAAETDDPSAVSSSVVIRHAGKTHIRGRIRRVWRPRYLELTSDGRLQYYEYSSGTNTAADETETAPLADPRNCGYSTSSSSQPPDNVTACRPRPTGTTLKYTLVVTTARILDVTTIRDLHTGLMRGSFGFVIRGQRLSTVEDEAAADFTSTTMHVLDLPPLDTAHAKSSFRLAPVNESLDVSTAGSGRAETTPSLLLPTEPVRDYLCAVSTLEEAQMWVVALQWAASLYHSSTLQSTTTTATCMQRASSVVSTPTITSLSTVDQWWKVDYFTSSGPAKSQNTNVTRQQPICISAGATGDTFSSAEKNDSSLVPPPSRAAPSVPTMSVLPSASPVSPLPSSTAGKGKILVTAVTNYSLIRWTTWTLEIAYEIHAILLYETNTSTTSTITDVTSSTGSSSSATMAEQWSIRRTAAQIETLALELLQHRCPVGSGTPVHNRSKQSDDVAVIQQLPQWKHKPTAAQVDMSLSVVDSILQGWVLSADIANTLAFKQFLGLTDGSSPNSTVTQKLNDSTALQIPWWRVHSDHPYAIVDRKVRQPVPLTKESYVKDWLLRVRGNGRRKAGSAKGLPQWLLQLRHDSSKYSTKYLLSVGGVVVATSVMPSLVRGWHRLMPVMHVRLDLLMASWAGASYLGYWFHSNRKRSKSTRHLHGSVKTAPRATNKHTSTASLRRVESVKRIRKDQVPSVLHATVQKDKNGTSKVVHVATSSEEVTSKDDSTMIMVPNDDSIDDDFAEFSSTGSRELFDLATHNDEEDDESDGDEPENSDEGVDGIGFLGVDDELSKSTDLGGGETKLSSPLPQYPDNNGLSCWSQPRHDIFHVRGAHYFSDKVKVCSGPGPLQCRGVDIWLTDNPERHIARNPAVLGGKLGEKDTFLVNFLLPFGNFVSYFAIPPLREFPDKLGAVWTKFLKGDQEYRDARLKLLPVVVDGPWIVKTAVGPGKSPAVLGKAIPLQYYFREPEGKQKGVYEVDVIITASSIAKGILSIVKSQTKCVSIAFAFIIEATEQSELPETVLCCFQVHSLHLEDCPTLPKTDQVDD